MAGLVPAGADRARLRATYVANLRLGGAAGRGGGRDVLIEPINTRDIPGFFLNRQDEAHAIVQEVGAPNLKVQMDLYHCQIVEGDLAMKIRQYLPTGRVGHIQIAGVPERHEPDLGELNYPYLFALIDELGCGADVVILAVPDTLIGRIAAQIAPQLRRAPCSSRSTPPRPLPATCRSAATSSTSSPTPATPTSLRPRCTPGPTTSAA
jgi:sugar phosphate isomerase/epimerase